MRYTILIAAIAALAGHPALAQQPGSGDEPPIQPKQAELPPGTETLDQIVAIVGDGVVLRSELERGMQRVRQQIRQRGDEMPPEDILQRQVLDRLIMQKLQIQRAEGTGIRVSDADVDDALRGVAEQNGISVEQLRETMERDGMGFGEFRQELREQLLIQRLRQRVIESGAEVSDTEVEVLMASEEFGGQEYNLSHIMIEVRSGATPEQIQAARERVQEVQRRLQQGLDFSAAAVTYSDAPDALDGGELGWRGLNAMPRAFADVVGKLQPGEVSEPIGSPAGFHLVRVNDVREGSDVVVKEVRARHIVIETSEFISSEQARQRIEEVKRQIADGASFAQMARQHSDDEMTANQGGDMGWFRPSERGPRYQEVLDSLEPGQVSEPFQLSSGWHLVKLEDRRQTDITLDARRNRARSMLRQQKGEEEYRKFLRQLRGESYIEVRLD